jgi:hypothetical protein
MIYTFDDILFSDLYKDAYGHRPSHRYILEWFDMTSNQRQDEWDLLLAVFAQSEAREKEQEQSNIDMFYERIERMMDDGAESKEQAIRWICDAEDIDYNDPDLGYICFQLGLPYSMENEVRG